MDKEVKWGWYFWELWQLPFSCHLFPSHLNSCFSCYVRCPRWLMSSFPPSAPLQRQNSEELSKTPSKSTTRELHLLCDRHHLPQLNQQEVTCSSINVTRAYKVFWQTSSTWTFSSSSTNTSSMSLKQPLPLPPLPATAALLAKGARLLLRSRRLLLDTMNPAWAELCSKMTGARLQAERSSLLSPDWNLGRVSSPPRALALALADIKDHDDFVLLCICKAPPFLRKEIPKKQL